MNQVKIDLERRLSGIDRNIFGGFVEHLGRCVHGGIHDPGSSRADERGLRTDVIAAADRLGLANIRYPGGNFVSGYRWRDGVGPLDERPSRLDLAWGGVESNTFGTNEFIAFCRLLGTQPYFVVNCGDGDLREARDWVEYCNGTTPTALTRLRERHGFPEPHRVGIWGVGNEVDGPWQIGYKSPAEYARAYLEFAKVMRWVDPSIKLVASAVSLWGGDVVERSQLLVEAAADKIDYMSIHWYVGNKDQDDQAYMAVSELIEERLSGYEGLMCALALGRHPSRPIPIAVDEWNVWYRATPDPQDAAFNGLEETYDLEDALVVAMHLNAFIRHAATVRLANLAQLVNVIAPIVTSGDDMVLQTIFFPFELYSRTCGDIALDVWWAGDTFTAGGYSGVRTLDVAASLHEGRRSVSVYAVNRDLKEPLEVELRLQGARFTGEIEIQTVNGSAVKATNTLEHPNEVATVRHTIPSGHASTFVHTLEPHSVTGFVFNV
jgi:alpha-N-arabinofuranosidase